MSSSLQVAGLASGFDWKSFVDQIIEIERTPANRLAAEKSANSQKANLLGTLGSRLSALQTAAQALKADSTFGQRIATSSLANSTWTLSAGANALAGTYKIAVSQLATAASLKGTADIGAPLNPAGNDVSGLTIANLPIAQAISAGTFTVNGQKVTVALTDSLQDVFDAISSATGGEVTASYDHTTDRVTLSNPAGPLMLGAANDTSNFLRALKLGNNNANTVTSSGSLGAVKTSATLANANLAGAITAVDGEGNGSFSVNGVSISYNVNTDAVSTVLRRINDSGAGVSASYDALTDRFVLTNKSTGDLGVFVSEDAGGLLGALGLAGGSTLTRGKNAEFTLNDGDTFTSASNTLGSSSHGIPGLNLTVTSEDTQTITVAADTGAIRAKIQAFIEKYNEVQQFIEAQTKVSTDSKGKITAAPLSANREIQEWARSLRSMAFAAIGGLTGSITRITDLGLDFKPGSNELEIDDSEKLDAALARSTQQVEAFFATGTTGLAAKFDALLQNVTKQTGDQQKRLNTANSSLDDQIAAIERRLEQQRTLLEAAFLQMENAQSRIKQQQSAIDGMWAAMQKK
jgi:flagellar hook-associated protein 2